MPINYFRLIRRTESNKKWYKDYISIYRGTGCFSSIGRVGNGKQYLSLGNKCANDVGTPIHEIMHALGIS